MSSVTGEDLEKASSTPAGKQARASEEKRWQAEEKRWQAERRRSELTTTYHRLKVRELKHALSQRRLKTDGTKARLVERLVDDDVAADTVRRARAAKIRWGGDGGAADGASGGGGGAGGKHGGAGAGAGAGAGKEGLRHGKGKITPGVDSWPGLGQGAGGGAGAGAERKRARINQLRDATKRVLLRHSGRMKLMDMVKALRRLVPKANKADRKQLVQILKQLTKRRKDPNGLDVWLELKPEWM